VAWVQSIQQSVHHPCMCSSHSDVGSEHSTVGPQPLHVLVPEWRKFRAYNSWPTTLACARPTVTWVQSIHLLHLSHNCSALSNLGQSMHHACTITLACACAALTQSRARTLAHHQPCLCLRCIDAELGMHFSAPFNLACACAALTQSWAHTLAHYHPCLRLRCSAAELGTHFSTPSPLLVSALQ
jgi:hypothetical protein